MKGAFFFYRDRQLGLNCWKVISKFDGRRTHWQTWTKGTKEQFEFPKTSNNYHRSGPKRWVDHHPEVMGSRVGTSKLQRSRSSRVTNTKSIQSESDVRVEEQSKERRVLRHRSWSGGEGTQPSSQKHIWSSFLSMGTQKRVECDKPRRRQHCLALRRDAVPNTLSGQIIRKRQQRASTACHGLRRTSSEV